MLSEVRLSDSSASAVSLCGNGTGQASVGSAAWDYEALAFCGRTWRGSYEQLACIRVPRTTTIRRLGGAGWCVGRGSISILRVEAMNPLPVSGFGGLKMVGYLACARFSLITSARRVEAQGSGKKELEDPSPTVPLYLRMTRGSCHLKCLAILELKRHRRPRP